MEKELAELRGLLDKRAERIEEKLHGLAVQIGIFNNFCSWLKTQIEAEIAAAKEAAGKGGAT